MRVELRARRRRCRAAASARRWRPAAGERRRPASRRRPAPSDLRGARQRIAGRRRIEGQRVRQQHRVGVAVADAGDRADGMADRHGAGRCGRRAAPAPTDGQRRAARARAAASSGDRRTAGSACGEAPQRVERQRLGERRALRRIEPLDAVREAVHAGGAHQRGRHLDVGLRIDQHQPRGELRVGEQQLGAVRVAHAEAGRHFGARGGARNRQRSAASAAAAPARCSVAGGVKRHRMVGQPPPSASSSATALAVSDALPPPTATKPSTSVSRAMPASRSTSATIECAGTSPASTGRRRRKLRRDPAEQRRPLRRAAGEQHRAAHAEQREFGREAIDRAVAVDDLHRRAALHEGRRQRPCGRRAAVRCARPAGGQIDGGRQAGRSWLEQSVGAALPAASATLDNWTVSGKETDDGPIALPADVRRGGPRRQLRARRCPAVAVEGDGHQACRRAGGYDGRAAAQPHHQAGGADRGRRARARRRARPARTLRGDRGRRSRFGDSSRAAPSASARRRRSARIT